MASGPVVGRGSRGLTVEAGGQVIRIKLKQQRLQSTMLIEHEWPSGSAEEEPHSPTPPDSGTSSDLDPNTPPSNFDSLSEFDYQSDPCSKISFYNFHLSEIITDDRSKGIDDDEDTFAGHKYVDTEDTGYRTIWSSKGTIRGFKNRVRAGIATFLHVNKSWQEKETGQIVIYTTTMGIVRETATRCQKVKHILRTHLVKFVEKDCFMSREFQAEIKERTGWETVPLPVVFINGQYFGDADVIEKLNETGELRRIMKPFKNPDAFTTCQACGGYKLLPCGICNGSKKSVHRNHFTTELVALKCMNCDEVGLVKCFNC